MRSLGYWIRFRVGLPIAVGELSMGRGLRRQGPIALTNIRGSWLDHTSLSALYEGTTDHSLLRRMAGDVSHHRDAVRYTVSDCATERSGTQENRSERRNP
jgi:hypothetical protein